MRETVETVSAHAREHTPCARHHDSKGVHPANNGYHKPSLRPETARGNNDGGNTNERMSVTIKVDANANEGKRMGTQAK